MAAREFIALMASGVTFLLGARPDLTLSAIQKRFIRQAPATFNIFYRKGPAIGKRAFAGNLSLVKIHQPLLEFAVIVTVSDVNGTDSAIESTGRNKIRVDLHKSKPPDGSYLSRVVKKTVLAGC
jgi:hypothetical protein